MMDSVANKPSLSRDTHGVSLLLILCYLSLCQGQNAPYLFFVPIHQEGEGDPGEILYITGPYTTHPYQALREFSGHGILAEEKTQGCTVMDLMRRLVGSAGAERKKSTQERSHKKWSKFGWRMSLGLLWLRYLLPRNGKFACGSNETILSP